MSVEATQAEGEQDVRSSQDSRLGVIVAKSGVGEKTAARRGRE